MNHRFVICVGLLSCLANLAQAQEAAVNLAKPANQEDSWHFEQHDEATGELSADSESVTFSVTKITDQPWHVQVYQHGFDFEEGASYRVSFSIRSAERIQVLCHAMINEPEWSEVGLHETIYCRPEFENKEYTFKAAGVKKDNNRFGFQLGFELGTVTIKDLQIEKVE